MIMDRTVELCEDLSNFVTTDRSFLGWDWRTGS